MGHRVPPSLLLCLLLLLLLTDTHAAVWNRRPADAPDTANHAIVGMDMIDAMQPTLARALANSSLASDSRSPTPAQLIILLHGTDADHSTPTNHIYLLPWPLSSSRHGQQRWLRVPLLGSQPVSRIFHSAVAAPTTSSLTGGVIIFGGLTGNTKYKQNTLFPTASLWVLNMATTKWVPLGPSKFSDPADPSAYSCDGKYDAYGRDLLTTPLLNSDSVDGCFDGTDSSLPQVDEFGCPWPTPRYSHTMTLMGDRVFIFGGLTLGQRLLGDVWILHIDDAMDQARQQQAESKDGRYVYNEDQLKFLANRSDTTIRRDRLCPVRWELVSRPDGSASLLSQPSSAPFPVNRYQHAASASGRQLWLTGGYRTYEVTSDRYIDDIWVLDTIRMAWKRLSIIPSSTRLVNLVPSARTYHVGIPAQVRPTADTSDGCTGQSNDGLVPGLIVGGGVNSQSSDDPTFYLLRMVCNASLPVPIYNITSSSFMPSNPDSLHWRWEEFEELHPSSWEGSQGSGWFIFDNNRQLLMIAGYAKVTTPSLMRRFDFVNRTAEYLPQPFASVDSRTRNPYGPTMRGLGSGFLIGREFVVYLGRSSLVDVTANVPDMWSFHVDSFEWRLIGSGGAPNTPIERSDGSLWPENGSGIAVASDGVSIYRFGGGVGLYPIDVVVTPLILECSSQFWRFDLATTRWTNLTGQITSDMPWTNETSARLNGGYVKDGFIYPYGRCLATSVILGDEFIMFGGLAQTTDPTANVPLDNALWALHLPTLRWRLLHESNVPLVMTGVRLLTEVGLTQPLPRRAHVMTAINSDQLLIGFGWSAPLLWYEMVGSVWLYTRSENVWKIVSEPPYIEVENSTPSIPQARIYAQATVIRSAEWILQGGVLTNSNYVSDVWLLNLHTWEWRLLTPDIPATDTQILLPSAGSMMVALDDEREVFFFGGLDNAFVHLLEFDEFTVGGVCDTSIGACAHDFFAGLQLSKSNDRLTQDPNGFAWVALHAFSTIAGAISYVTNSLNAGSATLIIRDNEASSSSETTRALSDVVVRFNLTLRSDYGSSIPPALIDCRSHTRCSLSLDGSSSSGGSSSSSLTTTSDIHVELRNIIFKRGRSKTRGGCIYGKQINLKITDVVLSDCYSSSSGGGLALEDVTLSMSHSSVLNGCAPIGGGIYAVNSKLRIINSTIESNRAAVKTNAVSMTRTGQGGGIWTIASNLTIIDSKFVNNSARYGGGLAAVAISSPVSLGLQLMTVTITGNLFDSNSASLDGGGIWLSRLAEQDEDATVDWPIIHSTLIRNNSALRNGGGIFLSSSLLLSNGTYFDSNSAQRAGGGVYFVPSGMDPNWSNLPIFYTDTTNIDQRRGSYLIPPTTDETCDNLPGTQSDNANCNQASYGSNIASPPASLRIVDGDGGIRPSQPTGSPVARVRVVVIDAYESVVVADSSSFVSLGPITSLGGASSLPVVNGVADFDALQLRLSPNSSVAVQFSSSLSLAYLSRDAPTSSLQLILSTSRDASLGLQLGQDTNTSVATFHHASSCLAVCTFALPAPVGAHATWLTLRFDTSMFVYEYDKLTIEVDKGNGAGFSVLHTFLGTTLDSLAESSRTSVSSVSRSADPAPRGHIRTVNSLSEATFYLPSDQVRVTLQVGDDRVNYVNGEFYFTYVCPDGLVEETAGGACLQVITQARTVRTIMVVIAVAAFIAIILCAATVGHYYHRRALQLSSTPMSIAIFVFFLLLPIEGINFALEPSISSDGLCVARIWLGTISLVGALSIMMSKAARIVHIARSSGLRVVPLSNARMIAIVVCCLTLQVILCIAFTVERLSRSHYARTSHLSDNGASESALMVECSLEDGFTGWFATQLAFFTVLVLLTGWMSFQTRGVISELDESGPMASSLTLITLFAVIFVPVAMLVQDNVNSIIIIQSGGSSFIAVTWCLVLFVPRILTARQKLKVARKVAAERERQKLQALTYTRDSTPTQPDTAAQRAIDRKEMRSPTGATFRVDHSHNGDDGERRPHVGHSSHTPFGSDLHSADDSPVTFHADADDDHDPPHAAAAAARPHQLELPSPYGQNVLELSHPASIMAHPSQFILEEAARAGAESGLVMRPYDAAQAGLPNQLSNISTCGVPYNSRASDSSDLLPVRSPIGGPPLRLGSVDGHMHMHDHDAADASGRSRVTPMRPRDISFSIASTATLTPMNEQQQRTSGSDRLPQLHTAIHTHAQSQTHPHIRTHSTTSTASTTEEQRHSASPTHNRRNIHDDTPNTP